MTGFLNSLQDLLDRTRGLDFLAPLALRLYLVPIFMLAGSNKLEHAEHLGPYFASWAYRSRRSWSTWPPDRTAGRLRLCWSDSPCAGSPCP